MAFLDIMPLTRGHVLVVTREHYETLGGVGVDVGREVSITISYFYSMQYRNAIGEKEGKAEMI